MQRLCRGRTLGDLSGALGVFTGARQHREGVASAQRAVATRATASSSSSSSSSAPTPRVVVLGGGFGGLYAAVRLDQLMWPRGRKPQVTLVDQSDRFVFKPLLYELVNGTASEEEVAPPLSRLLAPYPVRLVQAQVAGVEPSATPSPSASSTDAEPPAAGSVTLADGSSLPYDYLLVALGSGPDDRGVPGVRAWAVPFAGLDDALRVKGSLDVLADSGSGGSVAIVGGGYAGVELAAVVAERLRKAGGGSGVEVLLLTPGADVLEGCPEGQRQAARAALEALGVRLVTGARVTELSAPAPGASASSLPTACTLSYTEGASQQQLAADLVVWTAGSSPATSAGREAEAQEAAGGRAAGPFPFPRNARGAILTEPSLVVAGSGGRVLALGDVAVASPPSSPAGHGAEHLPATAQVAFQQADYAAWNIWAAINGRPLLPFRYQHLGSMMALGQLNAAVALPLPLPAPLSASLSASPLAPLLTAAGVRLTPADPAGGVTLEGPLAALLRRGAYLYRQPTAEQRLSVAAGWLRQGLEAAAALAGGRAR